MSHNKDENCKEKQYETIMNSQRDQLIRYEKRLNDIVTAYKGLAKEKAALEATLRTIKQPPSEVSEEQSEIRHPEQKQMAESCKLLPELQIQQLMTNITTLSEERKRVEETLKLERSQLRLELARQNETIQELTARLANLERPSNDICDDHVNYEMRNETHLLTIRELKKMLDDERNLKEKLELQLGNLKTQILLDMPQSIKKKSVERHLTSFKNVDRDKNSDASLKESLQGLRMEMLHLKKQYATIVSDEKTRARLAEERSTRLGELHEERVANLEARISELSDVIGKNDRLREQDKETIQHLKETIARMKLSTGMKTTTNADVKRTYDFGLIEDGYGALEHSCAEEQNQQCASKALLLTANLDGNSEQLVTANNMQNSDPLWENCELEDYKRRYDQCMSENQKLKEELLLNLENTNTLKQQLDNLKRSTEQLEIDFQYKLTEYAAEQKKETTKHSDAMSALQTSFERQIGNLQHTLQKQRERSLAVIEEKEEEIKVLRTSSEILSLSTSTMCTEQNAIIRSEFTIDQHRKSNRIELPANDSNSEERQHLLHYAQEIARKNVEISTLRTSKNTIENMLRQTLHEKVIAEERLNERIVQLEKELGPLKTNHTLDGSNLKYLKNVILSFLLTDNTESKKHMTNAIAAVLNFDESEIQAINDGTVRLT
ncbi:GRIP and coiled-coil domain-containing protein 1-like [Anopheles cruzii]|uniref:GRIP and coiled-coil domain-containing protein 1-like n=1 Tax=Anopheles cruzii TaxID=68878 RepID=UPI0022EC1A90|nr:GRIP and coiled-coil domain-containing protein 1-like [Anopheles cruzii]